MSKTITVVDVTTSHVETRIDDIESMSGLSIRRALAALREIGRSAFGNIGTMNAELSDGSHLSVELQRASEPRTYLMSSQRIRRYEHNRDGERTLCIYPW